MSNSPKSPKSPKSSPSQAPKSLDRLLPAAAQARVVDAIRRVEARTTGQIKVHLDEHCPEDPRQRAETLFASLHLGRTAEHNGVLLYVAVVDRKYALLADAGIHEAAGSLFWHEAAGRMARAFAAHGELGEGLVATIEEVGARLAERFPSSAPHPNEIPDDISHD